MAAKATASKSLNAANLEAMGAARLAALLLELTTGDASARRQLKLAIASEAGPVAAAHEISKRLASIARSRTFLDRDQLDQLARELEAQRDAIDRLVAPTNAGEAFDLTWRLVECSGPVFDRSDDSDGRLSSVFDDAVASLAALAEGARLQPIDLAERAFAALRDDKYSVWNNLVTVLAPTLGESGIARLRQMMETWRDEPMAVPPAVERKVLGWSTSGNIYADEIQSSQRQNTTRFVLQQIADASGDVDFYIAQTDPKSRRYSAIATDIARRLLGAGRAKKALKTLDAVEDNRKEGSFDWENARADALDALGRQDEAQSFRLECFKATLTTRHLRAYLQNLPDFEDFDAEQSALAHALSFANFHVALGFLIRWPDLNRASQLVLARAAELNGDLYFLLSPAADALDDKYSLAATLVRRAMIDFTLKNARTSRYKHAQKHFRLCGELAGRIVDFGTFADHASYEQALRTAHGRKAAFWDGAGAKRS